MCDRKIVLGTLLATLPGSRFLGTNGAKQHFLRRQTKVIMELHAFKKLRLWERCYEFNHKSANIFRTTSPLIVNLQIILTKLNKIILADL